MNNRIKDERELIDKMIQLEEENKELEFLLLTLLAESKKLIATIDRVCEGDIRPVRRKSTRKSSTEEKLSIEYLLESLKKKRVYNNTVGLKGKK